MPRHRTEADLVDQSGKGFRLGISLNVVSSLVAHREIAGDLREVLREHADADPVGGFPAAVEPRPVKLERARYSGAAIIGDRHMEPVFGVDRIRAVRRDRGDGAAHRTAIRQRGERDEAFALDAETEDPVILLTVQGDDGQRDR